MSILGFLLLLSYIFPSLIAAARNHHNIGSIITINLLLGWTGIGWIVALAMAASAVRKT